MKGDNIGIQISKHVYQEMIDYSIEQLPYEACGLISGKKNYGSTLWKLENEAKSPYRFSMSSEAVSLALEQMAEYYEDFVGIFHSHPNTLAIPSERDIRYNPYPGIAYFIVSLKGPTPIVRCYRIKENKAEEITIEIIDPMIL